MTDSNSSPLSAAGEQRRATILRTAQAEMDALHRSRRIRKSALMGLGLLATLSGGLWWALPRPGHRPDAIPTRPRTASLANVASPWSPANVLVPSRPEVAAHYLVSTKELGALQAQPVTDEELLMLLDAAGHPSHLARIDGKLTVLPKRQPRRSET